MSIWKRGAAETYNYKPPDCGCWSKAESYPVYDKYGIPTKLWGWVLVINDPVFGNTVYHWTPIMKYCFKCGTKVGDPR